jgi:hypothetical protein
MCSLSAWLRRNATRLGVRNRRQENWSDGAEGDRCEAAERCASNVVCGCTQPALRAPSACTHRGEAQRSPRSERKGSHLTRAPRKAARVPPAAGAGASTGRRATRATSTSISASPSTTKRRTMSRRCSKPKRLPRFPCSATSESATTCRRWSRRTRGVQKPGHAAAAVSYSWMRPPSRSRRFTRSSGGFCSAHAGEGRRSRVGRGTRGGCCRPSAPCGRSRSARGRACG